MIARIILYIVWVKLEAFRLCFIARGACGYNYHWV